jgi:hypothetical protein
MYAGRAATDDAIRSRFASNGTVALVVGACVTETGAMRSRQYPCLYPGPRSAFAGYRFPPQVITA